MAALLDALSELLDGDPLVDELGVVLLLPPSLRAPPSAAAAGGGGEAKAPSALDEKRRILRALESGALDRVNVATLTAAEAKETCFVLKEHKLGVAAWAIQPLFVHAKAALESLLEAERAANAQVPQLLRVTRAVLLVSADHFPAWNARKRVIEAAAEGASRAEALQSELRLTTLVLSKHPKHGFCWAHRRWVLGRLLALDLLPLRAGLGDAEWMRSERRVSERAAELYPRNYYAWDHRLWLLALLERHCPEALEAELRGAAREWTDKHVGDYCGFHYRQELLRRRRASLGGAAGGGASEAAWRALVEEEYRYITDMCATFPGHEALWQHRRHVCAMLLGLHEARALRDDADAERFSGEAAAVSAVLRDSGVAAARDQHRFAAAHLLWLWWMLRRRGDPARVAALAQAAAEPLSRAKAVLRFLWNKHPANGALSRALFD
jgi:protein prenyltransferase alpha subunit repeat containing protein 1